MYAPSSPLSVFPYSGFIRIHTYVCVDYVRKGGEVMRRAQPAMEDYFKRGVFCEFEVKFPILFVFAGVFFLRTFAPVY